MFSLPVPSSLRQGLRRWLFGCRSRIAALSGRNLALDAAVQRKCWPRDRDYRSTSKAKASALFCKNFFALSKRLSISRSCPCQLSDVRTYLDLLALLAWVCLQGVAAPEQRAQSWENCEVLIAKVRLKAAMREALTGLGKRLCQGALSSVS